MTKKFGEWSKPSTVAKHYLFQIYLLYITADIYGVYKCNKIN